MLVHPRFKRIYSLEIVERLYSEIEYSKVKQTEKKNKISSMNLLKKIK